MARIDFNGIDEVGDVACLLANLSYQACARLNPWQNVILHLECASYVVPQDLWTKYRFRTQLKVWSFNFLMNANISRDLTSLMQYLSERECTTSFTVHLRPVFESVTFWLAEILYKSDDFNIWEFHMQHHIHRSLFHSRYLRCCLLLFEFFRRHNC